jgi:hypothetical protein
MATPPVAAFMKAFYDNAGPAYGVWINGKPTDRPKEGAKADWCYRLMWGLDYWMVKEHHFTIIHGKCLDGLKLRDPPLDCWKNGNPRNFTDAEKQDLEKEWQSMLLDNSLTPLFYYRDVRDFSAEMKKPYMQTYYKTYANYGKLNNPFFEPTSHLSLENWGGPSEPAYFIMAQNVRGPSNRNPVSAGVVLNHSEYEKVVKQTRSDRKNVDKILAPYLKDLPDEHGVCWKNTLGCMSRPPEAIYKLDTDGIEMDIDNQEQKQ